MVKFEFGERVKLAEKAAIMRRDRGSREMLFIGRMRRFPKMVYLAVEGRVTPEVYHESVVLKKEPF